ncbi:unnamed protein product, partial [Linum tenue]
TEAHRYRVGFKAQNFAVSPAIFVSTVYPAPLPTIKTGGFPFDRGKNKLQVPYKKARRKALTAGSEQYASPALPSYLLCSLPLPTFTVEKRIRRDGGGEGYPYNLISLFAQNLAFEGTHFVFVSVLPGGESDKSNLGMGRGCAQVARRNNGGVAFSSSGVKVQLFLHEATDAAVKPKARSSNVFFASVNQVGKGFGLSSSTNSLENSSTAVLTAANVQLKLVSIAEPPLTVESSSNAELQLGEVLDTVVQTTKKNKKGGFKWRIKVRNPALRRLISGGIAGAVSRTVVAPLETIRTHLMVGSSCGHSSFEVFDNIMKSEGWTGLFRGNFVNVMRVAPSKAIELFAYDTIMKNLTPNPGEKSMLPIPASSIAGGLAGITSTFCTYPLELLKTRITVQRGVYDNLLDAFVKIVRQEGPGELYRGLTASLIGVAPYTAANYFAYDTMRKAYKKAFKTEEIGNVMTLLIGSAAGAMSSAATFPLEVARKQMQAGALNGGHYRNLFHALSGILEKEGLGGLYRGLGPSCMKLVPAAGISFMCYEACKKILVLEEEARVEQATG